MKLINSIINSIEDISNYGFYKWKILNFYFPFLICNVVFYPKKKKKRLEIEIRLILFMAWFSTKSRY